MTPEQLDLVECYLNNSIRYKDLARTDWRRQTDVVRELFVGARMFVDLGKRAYFVDGRISAQVLFRAYEAQAAGNTLKGYFNRRCHDAGLKSRRLIIFDTVTTNAMPDKRGNGKARLHFHGVFELPAGWSEAELNKVLRRIFGNAVALGNRQLHITKVDLSPASFAKHYSMNGATADGPVGKLLYALAHAGGTYSALGLNEGGKRSRSTSWQGRMNRTSTRLARGIPSNFNRHVVFYDRESDRAGKETFEAWVSANRARLTPKARTTHSSSLRSNDLLTGTDG